MSGYTDDELVSIGHAVKAEQILRAGKMRTCRHCGDEFPGRADAKFCSTACRTASHRAKAEAPATLGLPIELTSRARWIRRSASKVPLTVTGSTAKSNDPTTWSTFTEASASTAGTGLGFVLNGDGIAAIDLDQCIENGLMASWAQEIVDANEGTFMEISVSGTGIHVWGLLANRPGRKIRDGRNIEIYTTGRYIALGKPLVGTSRELRPLVLP